MRRIVSRRDKSERMAFFSVVILLICAVVAWPNIGAIRGAVFIAPSSYRTTDGTITRSCSSYIGGKSSEYAFDIRYSYSVDGKEYSSNQVSFGARASKDRKFADAYARKYPVGLETVVYYKADEPTFAVLEPTNVGVTRQIFWGILAVSLASIGVLAASMWGLLRAH
ncbi:DUF3592 domain-containing protein [bacterium]|nr:MAG: DUF3592 domain-containing protein [bacterium]